MIADQCQGAWRQVGPQGAAGIGQDEHPRSELRGQADREDGLVSVVALVGMEAAAEVGDGAVGPRAQQLDLVRVPGEGMGRERQEVGQVDRPALGLAELDAQAGPGDERSLRARPAEGIPALDRRLERLPERVRGLDLALDHPCLDAIRPGK